MSTMGNVPMGTGNPDRLGLIVAESVVLLRSIETQQRRCTEPLPPGPTGNADRQAALFQLFADAELLVILLARIRKYAEGFQKKLGAETCEDMSPALAAFDRFCPDVRRLRDSFEHYSERYLLQRKDSKARHRSIRRTHDGVELRLEGRHLSSRTAVAAAKQLVAVMNAAAVRASDQL